MRRALGFRVHGSRGRGRGDGGWVAPGASGGGTCPARRGFSLLEVILALSILAGAMAVLGELARHGLESTRIARQLTYAQLICESKLAEITSGMTLPDPVDGVPVEVMSDPTQMGWLYSIEVENTQIDGLLAVRVTVMQDLPEEKRPVRCSLVRWVCDPTLQFAAQSSESESSSESGTSSGVQ